MTKLEFAERIGKATGFSPLRARVTVDLVFDEIAKALKNGEDVALIGFGTFRVARRAARIGRNPKTGEKLRIAARKVVVFKQGSDLKATLKHRFVRRLM